MLEEELEFAKKLALDSGKLILSEANKGFNIKIKGFEDIVTDVDFIVDSFIIEQIKSKYPSDAILTEESKDNLSRINNNRVWIVDPIDGTGNFKDYFVNKNKLCSKFGVQIGLAFNGVAQLGVVYIPIDNELFFAIKGQGAYKQNFNKINRLKVKKGLESPIFEFASSIYSNTKTKNFSRLIKKSNNRFGNVFGYCLSAIADNLVDVYAAYPTDSRRIGEWDLCAPMVILEEAGGIVTNFKGEKYTFNNLTPYLSEGVFACADKSLLGYLD